MSVIPPSYQKTETLRTGPEPLDVWLSPEVKDPYWDDFLRSTPCGQYQQSALWAEYKAAEGWKSHRVILTNATGIVGGFQILWKKKQLARVGYVSKGPVAHPESSALVRELKRLLALAAAELGLSALIAQDPDEAQFVASTSEERGFITSNPSRVIETTYLIDVSEDMEVIRARMRPNLRRDIRKARRIPVIVREGSEADLPFFFNLMVATASRQNAAPSPSSVESIQHLWRIFSPSKSIRLNMAESEGCTPTAQIVLIFGNRVSIWKEGWDGSHPNWHTGALLEDFTLEWAHDNGMKICDICSLSRSTALHILSGKEITVDSIPSRDFFNVRFGGYPKILPSAYIHFPNPLLRWSYRNFYPLVERYRKRPKKKIVLAENAPPDANSA